MSNKNTNQTKGKVSKKTILICAIAATVLVAVLIGIWFFSLGPTKKTGSLKGISVAVVPKSGSMTVVTLSTKMVYLGDALEEHDIIEPGDSDNGKLHTVKGIKAESSENAQWKLYIDGKEATTGVYETMLVEGAHYRLEYTVGG